MKTYSIPTNEAKRKDFLHLNSKSVSQKTSSEVSLINYNPIRVRNENRKSVEMLLQNSNNMTNVMSTPDTSSIVNIPVVQQLDPQSVPQTEESSNRYKQSSSNQEL